jgi:hypothetical protein
MIRIIGLQAAPTRLLIDLYFGEDIEEIEKEIDDKYDKGEDEDDFDSAIESRRGFCGWVYDKENVLRLLIYVRDPDDLITLGHEIIHATWYVQYFSGFRFAFDSQEIQAYLYEYIMTEVLKQLNNESI